LILEEEIKVSILNNTLRIQDNISPEYLRLLAFFGKVIWR